MIARELDEPFQRLRALVGCKGEVERVELTRRDIARFAVASGETSPVYRDVDAAREAGHPDVPCPPVMLSAVIEWGAGPPLSELREDGTGVGRESWLPLEGLRLMGGGQDLRFQSTAYANTEVVFQPSLESVERKAGRSGELLLIVIVTEYRSAAGEALATCRETLIAR